MCVYTGANRKGNGLTKKHYNPWSKDKAAGVQYMVNGADEQAPVSLHCLT